MESALGNHYGAALALFVVAALVLGSSRAATWWLPAANVLWLALVLGGLALVEKPAPFRGWFPSVALVALTALAPPGANTRFEGTSSLPRRPVRAGLAALLVVLGTW